MELLIVGFFLLTLLITGVVAGAVWESRGGSYAAGFWLGALLGALGLFYVAFAQPTVAPSSSAPLSAAAGRRVKTCPRCAENVKAAALVCRFCGHEFPPPKLPPQREPQREPQHEPQRHDGRDVLGVVDHAFGVRWGRTSDGDVVYRPKDADGWLRYEKGKTPLVPPAIYRRG